MIKVSSRFLAVLMLAVLAFTDLTTTSAFAQRGGAIRIRPPAHVEVPWRLDHALRSDPITRGRIFGEDLGPGGTCNVGCESNRLRDLPPQEENAQSEGVLGLRPHRSSPDPVLQ
jgi:hypothetical protein